MTGSINPLQQILAQYTEKIKKANTERGVVSDIIKSCTGVVLQQKEIEISEHTLYIKSHAAKRQILFFKKEEILESLQKAGFPHICEIK